MLTGRANKLISEAVCGVTFRLCCCEVLAGNFFGSSVGTAMAGSDVWGAGRCGGSGGLVLILL